MAAANAPMPLPPRTLAKGDVHNATSGRLTPGLAATGPGPFSSAFEGSPRGIEALGSASGQLQAATSLDYGSSGAVGAQPQTHLQPHHSFPQQQGMPLPMSQPAGTSVQHGTSPLPMQLPGGKPIAAALVNTHAPGLSLGPITAGWHVRTASTSTAASALANAAGADRAAAAMAALTVAHVTKPLGADVAAAVPGAGAGEVPDSAEAGGHEEAGSDAAQTQHQLGDAAAQATQRQVEGTAMEQLGGQSQKQGMQAVAGTGSADGGQGQSSADPSSAVLNPVAQARADACAEADSSSSKVGQQVQRGHHVKAMGAGTAGVDSGSDGDQAQSTLLLCDQSSSSSRRGSPSSSSLGADSGGEGEGESRNGRDGSGGSSGSPSRLINHHHHRSSESSAAAAGAEVPSSDESPAEEEGEGKPSRHLWLGNIPLRPNKAAMELLFR